MIIEKIHDYIEEGLTRSQIAEREGVHKVTVDRVLKRMGLSTGRTGPRAGRDHSAWKGGRVLDKTGYVLILAPLHPHARSPRGYIGEHRLLVEVLLGRYLKREEVVDHIDGNMMNNHPDNLRLFPCNADHLAWTLRGKERRIRHDNPEYDDSKSIQKNRQYPNETDTLAQCPLEIRQLLSYYIESHSSTNAHKNFARRSILRAGAWRNPFLLESRA